MILDLNTAAIKRTIAGSRSPSLRLSLMLAVALVLLPALGLIAHDVRTDYDRHVSAALSDELRTAQTTAVLVDSAFDEGLAVARILSADPLVQTMERHQVEP